MGEKHLDESLSISGFWYKHTRNSNNTIILKSLIGGLKNEFRKMVRDFMRTGDTRHESRVFGFENIPKRFAVSVLILEFYVRNYLNTTNIQLLKRDD